MKTRFAAVCRQRTRAEWCDLLEGADTCFAPVLTMREAPGHPHTVSREAFLDVGGVLQPAPAPRFSRTPGSVQRAGGSAGEHTDEVLAEAGLSAERIAALRANGAVG